VYLAETLSGCDFNGMPVAFHRHTAIANPPDRYLNSYSPRAFVTSLPVKVFCLKIALFTSNWRQ